MYCRKCGKEIENNSKFCPCCGNHLDMEQSHAERPAKPKELLEEPSKEYKSVNPKKWVIPVAAVSSAAIIGLVVFVGVRFMQKPPETTEQVTADIQKQDSSDKKEKVGKVEDVESAEDTIQDDEPGQVDTIISLEPSVKEQLELFVELLGWSEHFSYNWEDRKKLMEFDDSNLCHSFLLYSLFFDGYNKKNNDRLISKYTYTMTSYPQFIIAEEIAKKYLMDSIGRYDNSRMNIEGTNIVLPFGDTGDSGVDNVEITNARQVSENDIQIEGNIAFQRGWKISRTVSFLITMTANPESIWGGYTFKTLDCWEEEGDYILSEISTRYYSVNDLSSMDAHTLYLARNELYARHGYIFKTPELQEYFGNKSWYTPQVSEVPDSAFNEYEKKNLELIQKLEANF